MSQQEYDHPRSPEQKYAEEIRRIKHLLRQVCRAPNRRNYRLVERSADRSKTNMEWIINRLGYRPTRSMWEEAGVKNIDRMHVGHGPAWLDRR